MRLRWVLAALLVVPLADAALLIVVADALGWPATVALVVLTGLLGMLLVRAEGRHALRALRRQVARGEPPTDALLDGALLVAAGAFLLTPGLVTDAVGFLLAVPVTRYPVRGALKRYAVVPYLDRRADGFVTGRVWTGGFPGDGPGPGPGPDSGSGSGPGGSGSGPDDPRDDDTIDLDPDSYGGDRE